MRRPHRGPLSRQAVDVLGTMRLILTSNLLFPGLGVASRPISDGTLNAALRGRYSNPPIV
jgi:hypothetical protein